MSGWCGLHAGLVPCAGYTAFAGWWRLDGMGGIQVPARTGQQAGWRPAIRVLVAEDVAVVRETVVALLGLEPDIEVVAALASGDQIVPAAALHRPDVALLDIGLPGSDGLTAAAQLAGQLPGGRGLVLPGLG